MTPTVEGVIVMIFNEAQPSRINRLLFWSACPVLWNFIIDNEFENIW